MCLLGMQRRACARVHYLILLILAEGPYGTQMPAGTSAIRKTVHNQVHICQALLVRWRSAHG